MDGALPYKRFDRETLEGFSKEMLIDVVLVMQDHIVRLEARVEELERKLAQNSANSSRPPRISGCFAAAMHNGTTRYSSRKSVLSL